MALPRSTHSHKPTSPADQLEEKILQLSHRRKNTATESPASIGLFSVAGEAWGNLCVVIAVCDLNCIACPQQRVDELLLVIRARQLHSHAVFDLLLFVCVCVCVVCNGLHLGVCFLCWEVFSVV
jgi:hypothetical protein